MSCYDYNYKLELWYTIGKVDGVALHDVQGDMLAKKVFIDKMLDKVSAEDIVFDVEGFDITNMNMVRYAQVMFRYTLSKDGETLLYWTIEVI